MKDAEKELWGVIDQAIFKTTDSDEILKRTKASGAAWLQERSTLGGYLRQIRQGRKLTTTDCAEKTGFSRAQWQSWESNRETPTETELQQLCQGMAFGQRKMDEFLKLRGEAPRQRLLMFSRLRPELLAARGVPNLEASLEWTKLPSEIQKALSAWGEAQGLGSLEDIMTSLSSLGDEEARENWADQVLESLDGLV